MERGHEAQELAFLSKPVYLRIYAVKVAMEVASLVALCLCIDKIVTAELFGLLGGQRLGQHLDLESDLAHGNLPGYGRNEAAAP